MSQTPQIKDFFAFNTFNRVTAYTDNLAALESVGKTCERFEYLFSRTLPDSQIYVRSRDGQHANRVNAAVKLLASGKSVAQSAFILAQRFAVLERQARRYAGGSTRFGVERNSRVKNGIYGETANRPGETTQAQL